MKIFIPLLLLVPVITIAQPIPPKKAKKVFVSNHDSTAAVINKLALLLFERGFTIENKDEKMGFISTKEQPSKRFGTSMKVRAIVKDSMVVFTATVAITSGESNPTFLDVYFGGAKWSPLRDSWNELVAIASAYGKIVKYE